MLCSQREIQHKFLSTFTVGTNVQGCPKLVSSKEQMIQNGRMSSASTSRDIDIALVFVHTIASYSRSCSCY